MACKKLAKLSAAFNAIKDLYSMGELDYRFRAVDRDVYSFHNLSKPDSFDGNFESVKSCDSFDWSDRIGSDSGMESNSKFCFSNKPRNFQYFYRKVNYMLFVCNM